MTDKQRLDWMQKHAANVIAVSRRDWNVWDPSGERFGATGTTLRAAIDAAMKAEKGKR